MGTVTKFGLPPVIQNLLENKLCIVCLFACMPHYPTSDLAIYSYLQPTTILVAGRAIPKVKPSYADSIVSL